MEYLGEKEGKDLNDTIILKSQIENNMQCNDWISDKDQTECLWADIWY